MEILLKQVRKRLFEAALLTFCCCVRLWCAVRGCFERCWLYLRRTWFGRRLRFYRKASSTTSNATLDFALKQTPASGVHHKAKPYWVRPELLRLMIFMPYASVRLLAMTFNRLHFAGTGVSVGRSFVYEYRLRCRYEIAAARRNLKARSPIQYALNHTWGLDLTGKQLQAEGDVVTNPMVSTAHEKQISTEKCKIVSRLMGSFKFHSQSIATSSSIISDMKL